MKNVRIGIFSFLALLTIIGCYKERATELDEELISLIEAASSSEGLEQFKLPHHENLRELPQDPRNPLTEAKVDLGRMLFHETGLGINSHHSDYMMTFSCASCHSPKSSFQSELPQAIGDGGNGYGTSRNVASTTDESSVDVLGIRAPSLLNSAYQTNMNWNGEFGATDANIGTEHRWVNGTDLYVNQLGFEGLESQAIHAIDQHRMSVNDSLAITYGYKEHFDAAFPEVYKPIRYSNEQAGKAIAAYERTLVAYDAPFQKWLRGQYEEMLDVEKKGAILFFGKANCVSCHNGPALNSMDFYALGMKDLSDCDEGIIDADPNDPVNLGRGGYTQNPDDNYKFKVPQLYNLRDAHYLGHGSSFHNIEEVIRYKNKGVKENTKIDDSQLSHEFAPIGLTDEEVNNLAYFVKYALYDDNIGRYEADYILSDFCFPNNDDVSKQELGCN